MISKEKLIEWLKGMKFITVDENSTNMTEDFEMEHKSELVTNTVLNQVINFVNQSDDYNLTDELNTSFENFIEQVKREELLTKTNIHSLLRTKFNELMKSPLNNQYTIKRFMYMVTETYSIMTKYMECDIVKYSVAYTILMKNLNLLYDVANKSEL